MSSSHEQSWEDTATRIPLRHVIEADWTGLDLTDPDLTDLDPENMSAPVVDHDGALRDEIDTPDLTSTEPDHGSDNSDQRSETGGTVDQDWSDQDWSPLDRIDDAFRNLSDQTRPAPPLLPACLLGGPPGESMTPFEVRADLVVRLEMKQRLYVDGEHVVQRVWNYIAHRARDERGDWLLIAVGMAIGGLKKLVPSYITAARVPLVHSDLVLRMVEMLTNADDKNPFDLDAPYLYNRLMDRVRYAGTRSPRRSTKPNESEEWDEFEAEETARNPDSIRLPRQLELGDPLIILAGYVRDRAMTRLDAALLARTTLFRQTRAQAITEVRQTLPGDVNGLTDEALRGRLERARQQIKKIHHVKTSEYLDNTPGADTPPPPEHSREGSKDTDAPAPATLPAPADGPPTGSPGRAICC